MRSKFQSIFLGIFTIFLASYSGLSAAYSLKTEPYTFLDSQLHCPKSGVDVSLLFAAKLLTCPASNLYFNNTESDCFELPDMSISKETMGMTKRFLSVLVPVLAGKSTELLQNDLCQSFLLPFVGTYTIDVVDTYSFKTEDVYTFCDQIKNLPLNKAGAKALGKTTKALQLGKSGFGLFSAGASAYGAVKLSETILETKIPIHYLATLMTLAIILEQVTTPESLEKMTAQEINDYYVALDHWLMHPFVYKTLSTGSRYGFEKILQRVLFDDIIQKEFASWITYISHISQRSGEILARGSAIGLSKVLSGALAASVISLIEITLDAMSQNPEWSCHYDRALKYFQDLGFAIGTNFAISLILPSVLLAGTPKIIISCILIAKTANWLKGPSNAQI